MYRHWAQELAVLRQRRPCASYRQPLLAHRLLQTAQPRSRGLLDRRHPRHALLAPRSISRAEPSLLAGHSKSARSQGARVARRPHLGAPADLGIATGFALDWCVPRAPICAFDSRPARTRLRATVTLFQDWD